jgi:Flp pilus assembly pilin Flp
VKSLGAVRAVLADDRGQGLADYGLVLGFIAAVCVAIVIILGGNLQRMLTHVSTSI